MEKSISRYLQSETIDIVVLGNFNPSIFQPFWFGSKELISETEAESAQIEIIHPSIVRFSLDWIAVQITNDRCSFRTTKKAFFEPSKDLIYGTFSFLRETPITAIGFNHIYDFVSRTDEQFMSWQNKLVNFNIWNSVFQKPSLSSLEIVTPTDYGQIRTRIEVPAAETNKIQFNINNHYDVKSSKKDKKSELLVTLQNNWLESFKVCNNICNNVLKQLNYDTKDFRK